MRRRKPTSADVVGDLHTGVDDPHGNQGRVAGDQLPLPGVSESAMNTSFTAAPKTISARFGSPCKKCGGWMRKYEEVIWQPGQGAWHPVCPAVPIPQPIPTWQDLSNDLEAYPEVGDEVRVIGGETIPQGTEGTVRWRGDTKFGTRAGLLIDGQPKLCYISVNHLQVLRRPVTD